MKYRAQTKHRLAGDFEIKSTDDAKRTFRGALSTSHIDLGALSVRDIVVPGAFKRTLANFKAAKAGYIPLLDTHDGDSVFSAYGSLRDAEEVLTGKTLRYEQSDGGTLEVPEMLLDSEWQVIDGVDGDRLLDRMRSGAVRKMSMGYAPIASGSVQLKGYGKTRLLKEVALLEGSLVLFPMNPTADVDLSSVKSLDALTDLLRRGALSDEQKSELRALLDAPPGDADDDVPPPPDEPKGLAPDDPKRLATEALFRAVTLRSLASRAA